MNAVCPRGHGGSPGVASLKLYPKYLQEFNALNLLFGYCPK